METVAVQEIGSVVYEIIECGDNEHVTMSGNTHILGMTEYDSEKIYIHKDLNFAQKRRTLTHELCHAFLYEYANYHERYSQESVCDIMDSFAERILGIVNRVYNRHWGIPCD